MDSNRRNKQNIPNCLGVQALMDMQTWHIHVDTLPWLSCRFFKEDKFNRMENTPPVGGPIVQLKLLLKKRVCSLSEQILSYKSSFL